MRSLLAAKTPVLLSCLLFAGSASAQPAKHPPGASEAPQPPPSDPDAAEEGRPGADAEVAEDPTPPAAAPPAPARAASKPAKSAPPPKPKTLPLKKGSKAPRKPGSAAGAADEAARLSVTGGLPVAGDPGVEPPELAALRELDRALFPELTPGDSPWVLDGPVVEQGPRAVTTGLPPARPLPPVHEPEPAADLDWLRGLSLPDIPARWDSRVVRYLDYYKNTPRGRSMITVWIQRSGRYETKIRQALREQNLPEDIVWLSMMESGMNPHIRSPAGAVGLWQFTEKAAEAYGLRIDRWVDERLDPERSTQAAIRYLSDLHTRFGRWELAFAAYNMGYGGLLASIRKYNTNDYWELSRYEAGLPYETALYVPKIVAMAVVAANKETFGVAKVQPEAPLVFDEVAVGAGVTFEAIANAAKVDASEIQKLNPHLLGDRTPPALTTSDRISWVLRVPRGTADEILAALPRETPLDRTLERVRVRWGESLDDLAADRNITTAKLRQLNGLSFRDLVRPGDVVLLPRTAAAKYESREPIPVVVPADDPASEGQRRVFYKVAWGDTASGVAEALGVTLQELARWNALDPSAKLQSDMVLVAYVPASAHLRGVRLLADTDVRLLVQGSDAFFTYFEDQKGRRRIEIVAKAGDTWERIAKQYGITLGMLERINHRSRKSDLSEGDRLVLYVDRGRVPDTLAGGETSALDAGPRETGSGQSDLAASVR